MKNILLFTALFAFCLASCGSDDEPAKTDAELILGVWNLDTSSATNCDDPDDNSAVSFGPDTCLEFFGATFCFEGTIEFSAGGIATQELVTTTTDPTGDVTTETDTSIGTYEFTGDNLTICFEMQCNDGAYTLSSNAFTWEGSDQDGCDIRLTASK